MADLTERLTIAACALGRELLLGLAEVGRAMAASYGVEQAMEGADESDGEPAANASADAQTNAGESQ